MKIIFRKDDEAKISVFHKVGTEEISFSYVDMIKKLIETKKMEKPEIEDGFSEEETKSINSMADLINEKLNEEEL